MLLKIGRTPIKGARKGGAIPCPVPMHTPQVHLVQQQKNRYNKSVMAPFTVVQGWLAHLLAGLDVLVTHQPAMTLFIGKTPVCGM